MRIAVIGPTPPPNGGMAMQTQQLCRLLTEAGHDITFIATNSAYRPRWIGRIVVLRAFFRLFDYCWVLMMQLKNQQVVHLMANSGWSFYLFVMPAIYVASWYKIPIIVNYRGGNAKPFFARSWPYIKGAFSRVSCIIVPSEFLRQIFSQYQCQAQVVPNIVDLSIFDYSQPDLSIESLHIVVTRNLEKIYDNATAIKAFAIFCQDNPRSRLTIAGSGGEKEMLEQLTAELLIKDKVDFVGRLTRVQISQLYQSADILLNTSTVDNTPNSIIEALACGVIVITSNVGGIPFLVEDRVQAMLVEPRRADLIAKKLQLIVCDHQLSLSLADNGRQMVQQFSPSKVIPTLESTYQKVINQDA
jgi:glycosyltransferase involved in cell wall biosynthesis